MINGAYHTNLETSQDAQVLIASMLHTVGKCPAVVK